MCIYNVDGKLIEEYDKILERLECTDWVTKTIIFKVLAIHDKELLDVIILMSDDEFKEYLMKL